MTDKFVMFDLQDKKSKDIATLLSNDSARLILSHLSEHPSSESDLAKSLKIPLSTVHYNVQNLLRNELIVVKDSMYSQKGNKILVYETARRAIVLAPKDSSFWNTLRGPLSFVAIAGVVSLVWSVFTNNTSKTFESSLAMDAAESGMAKAVAPSALPVSDHNIALWFFVGAVFVAILSFTYNYWRLRK